MQTVAGTHAVTIGSVTIRLPEAQSGYRTGQEIEVGVRPEHVRLSDTGIPATVKLVQSVGPATQIILDWAGGTIIATLPGFVRLEPKTNVHFTLPPEHILMFDHATGLRL